MTEKPKTEKATIALRPGSKNDTDGATHVIRNEVGEMLAAWPDSGIARYVNGTIAPCKITSPEFDVLLRDLKLNTLQWKKIDDREEATTTMPAGKIAKACKVSP